jgi:hypothetical protein
VQALADSLLSIATLMRTQGLHFTMEPQAQRRTALVGRLMKQQAALADQLQAARNILLEDPGTERRLLLAGMLIQLLGARARRERTRRRGRTHRPATAPRPYWENMVRRMQQVFKAPIQDGDIPELVDYLVKTYGNEQGG